MFKHVLWQSIEVQGHWRMQRRHALPVMDPMRVNLYNIDNYLTYVRDMSESYSQLQGAKGKGRLPVLGGLLANLQNRFALGRR